MLTLTYAQTNAIYMSWNHPELEPGAARLQPELLTELPAAIRQLIPDPLPDETPQQAVQRAATQSWQPLLSQLGHALLPPELHDFLAQQARRGQRPRITIHPCPALAQVPWAFVQVNGQPLCAYGDVSIGVPRQVTDTPRTPPGQGRALIIDPKVPGQLPNSALGSVLGRPLDHDPLTALVGPDTLPQAETLPELLRRSDLDRQWLKSVAGASASLLYVGHVTAPDSEDGSRTSLHLCCTDDTGAHQPLTVADVFADEAFHFPARVALIACASGTDLQLYEPLGWVTTALHRGASFVVGTAWTLPTDAVFEGAPLRRVITGINTVLASESPLSALNRWQLELWRKQEPYPVVWGSIMGFVA